MTRLADFVTFNDEKLEKKYADRPIKMTHLYEAYFNGDIDIPGDISEFLRQRDDFVQYKLTWEHVKWAVTNFIWEVAIHSKKQDQRIVQWHYDRGNDFFEWFLGDRMVYTSAFFQSKEETLEQAQDNKLNLVAQKLKLKPGERLLDIGCGWGTLVRHMARHYGVDATGVTLAREQADYANARIKEEGLEDKARVHCLDYRDTPGEAYDKIVSLEMVEHVGVKNLKKFYRQVYDLLADDGLFLLQWTGLRRGLRPEDLIWGLFMNKYIFPGADASLCAAPMLKSMEKAGFEFHSVENISIHYAWTIQKWLENWASNKDAIVEKYGEWWYRVWRFFLAWSILIGERGCAACFQVVCNKNVDAWDRHRWILEDGPNDLGDRAPKLEAPAAAEASDAPKVDVPAAAAR